jgi:cation diffusion facilitator family transporter
MVPHPSEAATRRWLLAASYASVGVAITLILAKAVAWWLSGSASLLGSLLDSVMDSMASLVNMAAVRYALKPADADHRFGHGKAESLAALVQAGFILASSMLLAAHCAQRLLGEQPHVVAHESIGITVTIAALVLTIGLLALQSHVVKLTGSTAIRADSMHYRSDLLLNLVVGVALVSAARGFPLLDVAFGALIAVAIAVGAVRIGWEAFDMLMDRELPPEIDREILALALGCEGVLGVHDLRTRRAGTRYVIQLHLEFPDAMTLLAAHGVADEVERRLGQRFPGADVLIHQDPQSVVAAERHPSASGG